MSRTVFTDKQQLATDLARSPRTASPGKQWCKLISARRTQFHVPLGPQTFQLPQSLQDIGAIVPRAQGRSFLKQRLDGILCRVVVTHEFSRSHGQLLQKPQEVQQMLRIFVCRSLILHKHDAMYDIYHFILLWKLPHKWDKTARYHDAVYDT